MYEGRRAVELGPASDELPAPASMANSVIAAENCDRLQLAEPKRDLDTPPPPPPCVSAALLPRLSAAVRGRSAVPRPHPPASGRSKPAEDAASTPVSPLPDRPRTAGVLPETARPVSQSLAGCLAVRPVSRVLHPGSRALYLYHYQHDSSQEWVSRLMPTRPRCSPSWTECADACNS